MFLVDKAQWSDWPDGSTFVDVPGARLRVATVGDGRVALSIERGRGFFDLPVLVGVYRSPSAARRAAAFLVANNGGAL